MLVSKSGNGAAVLKPHGVLLQELLDTPQANFALVLSPTRELALQIAEQFEALGVGIGVRCAVLVGGIDMMAQAINLGKRPHIIVGTPGRVVDHLSNTKVLHSTGSSSTISSIACIQKHTVSACKLPISP